MAIAITVAGIDRTTSVRFETLTVVNTIATNTDTAELKIVVPQGSTWRPKAGNEVIVTNGTTREFGGVMMSVTEQGQAGPSLRYLCHCKDYLHLFNKKLVISESTDLVGSSAPTASQILTAIVAATTDGFSSTGILASPTVPVQKYDYVAPGDIARSLADLVAYAFWIDYSRVVNFQSAVALAAPVASINLDTDITNYGSMDITEAVDQLKNRVYVKGWNQKSTVSYSQSYTGDATSQFFMFGYEPSAQGDITATLNGTALSVGLDQVDASPGDGIGSSSSIYVCFDNLGFRFGNYAPTSTETLTIGTPYMTPGITLSEDINAQTTAGQREGGDGIHEYAYNSPALTASDGSNSLAQAKGDAILLRDAYARISCRFVSYTQGWRAGQTFQLISANRMTGINKSMYVQQVTKRLINSGSTAVQPSTGPLLYYELEAADSVLAQ